MNLKSIICVLCVIFAHVFVEQCSSQPVNCSSVKSKLRKRYMLVSKTSLSSLYRARKTFGGVSSSAKCPWTWGVSTNDNRYPRQLVHASCTGVTCTEYYCKPVKYQMMVLTRNGSEWGVTYEKITVAFVYTK